MHEFFSYLTKQAGRPDPIGDLADDFIRDNRNSPVKDIYDLYGRISGVFNSDAAKALTDCWREFTKDPFPVDGFCLEHDEWACNECKNNSTTI